MNRISQLFSSKKENIFSVYFCAGHPTLESVVPIIRALQDNSADMIEIGIPFSDPMADGPVIQNASARALNNGMSLRVLFSQLSVIRKEITIPLVLMGYLNPIMQYGFENFCVSCRERGIDGVIIPDLPFQEYLDSYRAIAKRYDIKVIMLITPETSESRIRLIDYNTDGFIYMVSSASTTGAQNSFDNNKTSYFRRIAAMNLKNPRMIGFGISNKSTFKAACNHAAGGIIGSKFVSLLESGSNPLKAVQQLRDSLGI